jgi:hypothetical protein
MHKPHLVILIIGFFFFSPPLSSAGQSRTEGNSGGLSQIVYAGKNYTVLTCRDLTQRAKNYDNESIAIQDVHIQKTDFYDAYRRQIFVSDRTGRYERVFVELYSPLSAVLEKMEGRTGILYGSIQCKPSFGSFIVTRWEIQEKKTRQQGN